MKKLNAEMKQDIENKIDQILKEDPYFVNSFYSIDKLLKKEGINYFKVSSEEWEEANLPSEADAVVLVDNLAGKNILVREELEEEDERFSLAHEVGHLYMHAKKGEPYYACRKHNCSGKEKEEEDEADYFAACLLMPKFDFIKVYNEVQLLFNFKSSLSKIYGVSEKAIEKRILELGL